MISRRRLGLLALAGSLAPLPAWAQVRRPAVRVAGRLDRGTIARFVQLVRQHGGEVMELDVTGAEADEPGGAFDIGEGQANRLTIEHRAGRRAVFLTVEGLYRRLPGSRYEIKGSFQVTAGRPMPNADTFTLVEVQEGHVDRTRPPPTVRL